MLFCTFSPLLAIRVKDYYNQINNTATYIPEITSLNKLPVYLNIYMKI